MAVEVVMPRLGWTMETGRLVAWLKQDGDEVRVGEYLLLVESDKAEVEVEALDSGVLRLPPDAPRPGDEVPVGALLGYLLQPSEPLPWGAPRRGAGVAPEVAEPPAPPTDAPPSPIAQDTTVVAMPTISPRARRIAAELAVDWSALKGSGRSGRIVERDVRDAAAQLNRQPAAQTARATPLARKVAAESGVDVGELASTLGGRRIVRADVDAANGRRASNGDVEPAGTPLSGVRRLTAMRMAESAHATAPVTLTTEADATELVRVRALAAAELKDTPYPVPSYTDLLLRLTALALSEHPALNATLHHDRVVEHSAIHIGVAVDTERGLLVPVVRDAGQRSVGQIAAETARLIAAARAGKSAPCDLSGGTFTITNLGMYEVDAFTPIINLPECAILGLGRIVARPVVLDEALETVAVRRMLALSLSFDHRVVDGAPAARFLKRVKHYVEHPYVWLLR